MKQYIDLLKDIIENGDVHENRTGVDTIRVWGRSITHNLQDGFPLLTTKKMAVKSSFIEMLGFIRGEIDVNWYKQRGCNIWNANHEDWHGRQLDQHKELFKKDLEGAEAAMLFESIKYREQNPDSLGYVYGYQWRNMNGFDQLADIYCHLKNRSNSRRLIMSGWNPSQFHMMCLPPCHIIYHFSIRGEFLDVSMTQRSVDCGLGLPFNIANTALICHIMAHCAGLKPGIMYWSGNDVHIYENHLDQLKEQISRDTRCLPTLEITKNDCSPWEIEFEDISISGYNPHEKIKLDMAV